MTALAANKEIICKGNFSIQSYPVAASTKIYKGGMVKVTAAGYLAPCAAEAGAKFAGIAYETVDNSSGSAGAKSCKVYLDGVFEIPSSGLTQADVGSILYASTDNDTSLVQGANEQTIGRILELVSATKAMVDISIQAKS